MTITIPEIIFTIPLPPAWPFLCWMIIGMLYFWWFTLEDALSYGTMSKYSVRDYLLYLVVGVCFWPVAIHDDYVRWKKNRYHRKRNASRIYISADRQQAEGESND